MNAKLQQEQLDIEVNKLGTVLHMARLPDEETVNYIGRLHKFIHFVLVPSMRGEMGVESVTNLGPSPLENFSAGIETGDELINQMSVVLKMLHLWDFRELQTDLNSLIVLGQEYTANPKTNASLGKVGR